MSKKPAEFAAGTYPLPGQNNGGSGGIGPTGPAGPPGGATYLPTDPPPNSTNNTLAVDASGNESWQPVGGYQITSFALSGAGVAGTVEVGSSIANINWAATFNFTPTSISVSCTGKPTQTPPPSGPSKSGTFAGPFTGVTNGTTVTVAITVVDPAGAPHTATANIVFAARVVWGSTTPPETAGQALWNALFANASALTVSGSVGNLAFTSGPGQDQTFGWLASFGVPVLKDSGGDIYPATLIGNATIAENGTSQSVNFYTVGVQGITFSWSLS